MKTLPLLLLLCAARAAAEPAKVGCTPVEAEFVTTAPTTGGAGAEIPRLKDEPGVSWDLGEKRTARLSVYLTRACALGLKVSAVTGGETSSPNVNDAVANLARMLANDAPDWTFSTEAPNTIKVAKDGTVHSTDLRKLLQVRLDAATKTTLGGAPVRVLFDGWLLFIVPENAEKSLNLSVKSNVYPWAYYDLTAYGLPRLVVRYDEDKAVLWALP